MYYDYTKVLTEALGIDENYVPVLNAFTGRFFTFMYYKDEMTKAGLDPRTSVRSMDDLDKLFADLKAYAEKTQEFEYVFDTGWDPWFQGAVLPMALSVALGYSQQDLADTYAGKIKWTDENGPYAAYFKQMKVYYDKGYLPKKFWTRSWDKDFEPGFIAKKSILAFHGPWLFAKTEAADANAKLSGFPFPANKDGKVFAGPVTRADGAVIFAANKDKPKFSETVKAFIWYNSPEIIKLRCEAMNFYPTWDLSEVGGVNLKNTQYMEVVKPSNEGAFGKMQWDSTMWPEQLMAKYVVSGKPETMQDDANAAEFGKYYEGKTQLKDLLQLLQKRWEDEFELN